MLINKEKLAKKMEDLKKTSSGGASNYTWKMAIGKHVARVLPYPHFTGEEEGNLAPELYFHYGIGGVTVLCLEKNFGKECPICNFADTLREDAKNDKEIWKQMKNIEAVVQPFVPVLVRSETEKDGSPMVKFWRMNKTNYLQLMEAVFDEDYEDFIDLKAGRDLKILKEDKTAQKPYGQITFTFAVKESAVAESSDKIKEIIAKIPNIKELYPAKTKEEVDKILHDMLYPKEKKPVAGVEDDVDEAVSTENKDMMDKLDSLLGD